MRRPWLAGLLGLLAGLPLVRSQEPLPTLELTALRAKEKAAPTERPESLPQIDSRYDIPPLLVPQREPFHLRPPAIDRTTPRSDYDPARHFLPDRNPGERHPPCPCLPLGRFWLSNTYFVGKTRDEPISPLATSGGTGVIGTKGTPALHDEDHLDHPFRSGFRLDGGAWLDHCQNWGIDASFFLTEATRVRFDAASNGDVLLARPYTSFPSGAPNAEILAGPGVGRGSISVTSPLTFLGTDVNGRRTLFCEDHYRLDLLAGYRFIRLSERLDLYSDSTSLSGNGRYEEDHFRTLNLFNGGQVGVTGEFRFDRVYLSGVAKIAFGMTSSRLEIDGLTRTQTGGVTTQTPGGLFTGPANRGVSTNQNFAVAPEALLKVGYQWNDHWRTFVGYNFVYISDVARTGQALDTSIGTTNNGVVHPLRRGAYTDFWMHGISVGLETRY